MNAIKVNNRRNLDLIALPWRCLLPGNGKGVFYGRYGGALRSVFIGLFIRRSNQQLHAIRVLFSSKPCRGRGEGVDVFLLGQLDTALLPPLAVTGLP